MNGSSNPACLPPAKTCQKIPFDAGIPLTAFAVSDVHAAACLKPMKGGVVFRGGSTAAEGTTVAVFEGTCGN